MWRLIVDFATKSSSVISKMPNTANTANTARHEVAPSFLCHPVGKAASLLLSQTYTLQPAQAHETALMRTSRGVHNACDLNA